MMDVLDKSVNFGYIKDDELAWQLHILSIFVYIYFFIIFIITYLKYINILIYFKILIEIFTS